MITSQPDQNETMTGRSSQPALERVRSPWLALERAAENLADLGIVLAGTLWFVIVFLSMPFGRAWQTGQEAFCYWIANLNSPYCPVRLGLAHRLRLLAGLPPGHAAAHASAVAAVHGDLDRPAHRSRSAT